jgi:hypothetical protein
LEEYKEMDEREERGDHDMQEGEGGGGDQVMEEGEGGGDHSIVLLKGE